MTPRRLLVFRHAKSDWSDPRLEDFDRPLAARGRRAAAAMGIYIADEGLAPDLVLCSAARRALQTWSVAARVAGIAPPVTEERALYMAEPEDLLARVRTVDDAVASLLVVGHSPGCERFACGLAGNRRSGDWRRMAEKFPTGALAVIDLDAGSWRDIADGDGRLERFVTPKDLV
jgi:phosphohistidine phosphatase